MSSASSASRGLMWVVIFFLWPATLAAAQQCWVAEISTVSFVFRSSKSLGPYPDNESIFSAAQNEAFAVAENRCGGTTAVYGTYHYDSDSCSAGVCIPWIRIREFVVRNEPAQCSTGFYYYGRNAALDAIPPPICSGTYTIRLTSNTGTESPDVLATIEPDKSTILVARVYDQNNQLVPNVGVKLVLEAKQNSGEHHHPDDTVAARTGTMQGQQMLTGNTGPNGQGFSFTYNAPSVSGDIDILATCTGGKNCTPQGPKQVWAGVKGLKPLTTLNDVYRLVGKTNTHPDNHYLTDEAIGVLFHLASTYDFIVVKSNNPGPLASTVLHLNDASLERGGIFDIHNDWMKPHKEHCRGTAIDIRANDEEGAIPVEHHNTFEDIARDLGADPYWEIPPIKAPYATILGWENRHYHVRLLGREGLQCP